nr:hypothetical protein [Lonsdalea britannica]
MLKLTLLIGRSFTGTIFDALGMMVPGRSIFLPLTDMPVSVTT